MSSRVMLLLLGALLACGAAHAQEELVTPLHSFPSITISFKVFNGSTFVTADTPSTGPRLLNTSRVFYNVIVRNNGNVNLTNVVVRALGTNITYPVLTPDSSRTWPLIANWAAGQSSRNATVTSRRGSNAGPSRWNLAHYYGAAPSLQLRLQVLSGSGSWLNADTPSGPPLTWVYGNSSARILQRVLVTNNGNVNLTNVRVGGNWREEGAPLDTIPTLLAGQTATLNNAEPWGPYSQSRLATVSHRYTANNGVAQLQLSNPVNWRASVVCGATA